MIAAMKFVFVAVAVICYMQTAEMARLPRDTAEPAANFFENLAKPEFWNTLSQNISSAFNEENLSKFGINADQIKDTFSKTSGDLQKNFAELAKNFQGMIEQNQSNQPTKARK